MEDLSGCTIERHRPLRTGRIGLSSTDRILHHLIRLVRDDDWTPEAAGRLLVEHSGADPAVLKRARGRIVRSARFAATGVSERMLRTLDSATGVPR